MRARLALALGLALLAAVARAGEDAVNEAKRALEAAIQAKDEAKAKDALRALGADDSERAVRVIALAAAAARDLDVYEDLVKALAAVKSEAAVKEVLHTAAADKDWTVRFLFVEALARLDRPDARQALFAAFDDKHESVASNAMRAASGAKSKAAVRPLIDAYERYEKKEKGGRLQIEAGRALGAITGEHFTTAGDWRRFWDANEASFDPAAAAEKRAAGEDRATVLRRVEDRGEYEFVEKLGAGDIVVVPGHSDECESVLEVLKLPFTKAKREEVPALLQKIDPRTVLVFNCEGDLGKAVKGDSAKALATFVERGGYLFTSDWGLAEEIGPAFGGFLNVGPTMPQEQFPVKIHPAHGAEKHPYLRDVFPENPYERAKMKWVIDNSAFGIKMTPKALALVESDELGKRFGAPAVAATFRYGQGAVLHVMGHFRMQRDASGDGFALQQLLVNFIVEKQKFRKKAPKGG
jgi:hypothetical protein